MLSKFNEEEMSKIIIFHFKSSIILGDKKSWNQFINSYTYISIYFLITSKQIHTYFIFDCTIKVLWHPPNKIMGKFILIQDVDETKKRTKLCNINSHISFELFLSVRQTLFKILSA